MKKATLVVTVALLAGLALSLGGQTLDGLAELHVQKIVLEPPSTVTRGEEVQVYARITNTGKRGADSFSVGFFYRPAREGEPWILLGAVVEEHLGPSQQDFLEETYTFSTADMELGTYEIKVVVDVSNQIPEVDELNNELTTSMVLVDSTLGLPELQPIRLTFAQNGTSEMDPWSITLLIENSGEYHLSSFDVRFLLDGDPLSIPVQPDTSFVPDTGATTTVVATLDPHSLDLAPGTYLVTAVADSSDQILEQDEGNNTISASLTIQTLELHPRSLRFDQPVVRLDDEVRVTSEIANAGNGLAKNVKVDFFINHLRFATAEVSQLGVEPEVATATLDPGLLGLSDAPKVYEIRVVVDPDNALHESDEANNELVRTLTILEPEPKKPELHPESLELTPASPAELGQGQPQTVTVASVIRNTGRADAEAFDVGFYYRVKGGRRWDPFPCADGVICGDVALPAGAQARIVGILPVVALPPGIYEVRVVADSTTLIDELDEANNELITTLTLLASRRPDLIVRIDSIEPSLVLQKGQTGRISATVSNVGEAEAEAFDVRFSYCDLVVGGTAVQQQAICSGEYKTTAILPAADVSVPPLGIGESTTIQVNIETALVEPGQYRIRSQVDPDKVVDEGAQQELNNEATTTLRVLGPDLLPIAATFLANPGGTVNQDQVDEIEFTLTIANAGPLAAGQFIVAFELLRLEDGVFERVRFRTCGVTEFDCDDLPYFGTVDVPGIGAAAQLPVACTLDLSEKRLEPGQYVVRVYVDRIRLDDDGVIDEGLIAEHDELNNSAELLLTLVGGPSQQDGNAVGADYEVHWANGRASIERILVYAEIANTGTGGPDTMVVRFEVALASGLVIGSVERSLAAPTVENPSVFVDTVFLEGTQEHNFRGPLAVGDVLDVTVQVLANDGTPDNNIGTRRVTVKD